MAAPPWGTRPKEYCERAKARAIAAYRSNNEKGLTQLEQAYLEAIKAGRINLLE